jgi:hypothetical protein
MGQRSEWRNKVVQCGLGEEGGGMSGSQIMKSLEV